MIGGDGENSGVFIVLVVIIRVFFKRFKFVVMLYIEWVKYRIYVNLLLYK